MLFRKHPSVKALSRFDEVPNTFIFRNALCMYLLALEWAAFGGVKDASPDRLRNDMIDMNFAAYATFFDGLLSADAKLVRIHQDARLLLAELFGCQLPGGIA